VVANRDQHTRSTAEISDVCWGGVASRRPRCQIRRSAVLRTPNPPGLVEATMAVSEPELPGGDVRRVRRSHRRGRAGITDRAGRWATLQVGHHGRINGSKSILNVLSVQTVTESPPTSNHEGFRRLHTRSDTPGGGSSARWPAGGARSGNRGCSASRPLVGRAAAERCRTSGDTHMTARRPIDCARARR
jgi:hypothetical protein